MKKVSTGAPEMNHLSGHAYRPRASTEAVEKAMGTLMPRGFPGVDGSTMSVRGTRMGWPEDIGVGWGWPEDIGMDMDDGN